MSRGEGESAAAYICNKDPADNKVWSSFAFLLVFFLASLGGRISGGPVRTVGFCGCVDVHRPGVGKGYENIYSHRPRAACSRIKNKRLHPHTHAIRPAVQKMWKEGATEAVLGSLGEVRTGCWQTTRVRGPRGRRARAQGLRVRRAATGRPGFVVQRFVRESVRAFYSFVCFFCHFHLFSFFWRAV